MKIFKDVFDFWRETWRESKFMFFLEAIGTIASVGGGAMLAFLQVPNLLTVFVFYTIGSACLLKVCHMRHSAWLLLMFSFFTMLNVIGLINHF